MSLHLSSFVKVLLTPPGLHTPSFNELSHPDFTVEVASLLIGGYKPSPFSFGVPFILHQPHAQISAVPEPSTMLLMALALAAIAIRRKAA